MQNSFIFNQISKLTVKFSSHLRYRNISFCLKFQIPMGHIQFFKVISQNRYFLENVCNDMENPCHFTCQKRFNQLNQELHISSFLT